MQDAEGFPRVERDLVQVEQLSQKLRAKAARADHSEESLAATRLLAQEGLNNRKCVPSPRSCYVRCRRCGGCGTRRARPVLPQDSTGWQWSGTMYSVHQSRHWCAQVHAGAAGVGAAADVRGRLSGGGQHSGGVPAAGAPDDGHQRHPGVSPTAAVRICTQDIVVHQPSALASLPSAHSVPSASSCVTLLTTQCCTGRTRKRRRMGPSRSSWRSPRRRSGRPPSGSCSMRCCRGARAAPPRVWTACHCRRPGRQARLRHRSGSYLQVLTVLMLSHAYSAWLIGCSTHLCDGWSTSQPCAGNQAQQAGGAPPQLSGRAAGYAQAVCELNQAVAGRKPYNAIAAFAAACTDEQPRESRSTSQPPVCLLKWPCVSVASA